MKWFMSYVEQHSNGWHVFRNLVYEGDEHPVMYIRRLNKESWIAGQCESCMPGSPRCHLVLLSFHEFEDYEQLVNVGDGVEP